MLAEIQDITLQAESESEQSSAASQPERAPFYIPPILFTVLGIAVLLAALFAVFVAIRSYQEKKEAEARMRRRQKRMSRMGDGVSAVDIDLEMERRRNYYTSKRSRRRRQRRP